MKSNSLRSDHMAGKVCMVAGATAGIGKIIATTLAGLDAEMIITGRNQQMLEDTAHHLRTETRNETIQRK